MKLNRKEKIIAAAVGGVWCFGLAALGVLGANYISSKGLPATSSPTAEAAATDTPMPTATPLPTNTPLPTATATRVVLPTVLAPEATEEIPLELPTLAAPPLETPAPAGTPGKETPPAAEPTPTLPPQLVCDQEEQAAHNAKVAEINARYDALITQIQNDLNQVDPNADPDKYKQLADFLQAAKAADFQEINEENTRHLSNIYGLL